MKIRHLVLIVLSTAVICIGQVVLDDGTKIRVRLEQDVSSANAEVGQEVAFSVTDDIKAGDTIVIAQGAAATGKITLAQPKRRMGRAGKLDYSIERVRAVDGEWVPLRYSMQRQSGASHATSTGIMTGGLVVALGPVGALMLLRHGKDVEVHKGVTYDLFTDEKHQLKMKPATAVAGVVPVSESVAAASNAAAPAASAGTGTLTVTSPDPGADIEVDGKFVGSTPAVLKLTPGSHSIAVKSGAKKWERALEVTAGSEVSVAAKPE
jgi:hypothetical protein